MHVAVAGGAKGNLLLMGHGFSQGSRLNVSETWGWVLIEEGDGAATAMPRDY